MSGLWICLGILLGVPLLALALTALACLVIGAGVEPPEEWR